MSVWGREDKSNAIRVFYDCTEILDITTPNPHTNFHLGDVDLLKGMVKEAGCFRVIGWYSKAVYEEDEAEDYIETLYGAPNR